MPFRAFEAAARHLSFEKAGDEIAVTASAVGQQIKSLEAWIGRPLFVRLPAKGVALTSLGQRYANAVTDTLNRLDEATAQALKPEDSHVVTVSVHAEPCHELAHPEARGLPRARARHRCACLGIDAADRFRPGRCGCGDPLRARELPGPADGPADGGVFLRRLQHRPAERSREAPCGSPTICAATRSSTRSPRVFRTTRPGTPGSPPSASTGIDTSRGPRFTHTYLCLQAAAAGQGVALATTALIGDHLSAGRLVRPFPHQVRGGYQYYIVCPEDVTDRPAIAAFRAWLLDEARAQAEASVLRPPSTPCARRPPQQRSLPCGCR